MSADALSGAMARRRALATGIRGSAVLASLAVVFVVLAVASDAFLERQNLINLLDQAALTGIVACAATIVIVSGNFDLSVGAIYALVGVVTAKVAASSGAPAGLAAGAALGLVLGTVNGSLVAFGGVNSFIATLATSIMMGGVSLALTGGYLVPTGAGLESVGTLRVAGLNVAVVVFLVAALACAVLLGRTTFGRAVFAVGGNAEVARFSGIHLGRVRVAVFALSGLAAAVAGMLAAGRIGEAQADVGATLAIDAIAAVAIGGTSILGGEGAVWRTVVGVLLIAMLHNGLTLLGVDATYQDIVLAAVIVGAVGLDALARRRR